MKKLILLAAVSVLALSACSAPVPTSPARSASASAASPAPSASAAAGASCAYTATGDAVKQVDPPPATGIANQGAADYVLTLNGEKVNLTLDQASAPCTVNSFTSLAAQGFFDGSSCHRLVDDSGLHVLQCGDPSGTGSGGPGYQFADELTGAETYPAGTLAMANAGPGTNGSQFFMVFADSQLSPDYTVFGHVDAAGIKVLESIAKGGDDNSFGSAGGGKPNLPAVITSVQPA